MENAALALVKIRIYIGAAFVLQKVEMGSKPFLEMINAEPS